MLSNTLHRITVDEYRCMGEAGVFAPDSHIELIEGELFERLLPMNPPHAMTVGFLNRHFTLGLGDRAYVSVQIPVTLGDHSEPQPDISIVTMPLEQFRSRHPASTEIFAAIEVSDSLRKSDLALKVPLYAAFGIPETWVVDLVDLCVRVFRDPRDGEYRDKTVANLGDTIVLSAFPTLELSVSSIFAMLRRPDDLHRK
jgi:Uma2 family endonuclease